MSADGNPARETVPAAPAPNDPPSTDRAPNAPASAPGTVAPSAVAALPSDTPPVKRSKRSPVRFLLMVAIPLAVVAGGAWMYLQGGRYITTDNAQVGAEKVLITPDVSGRVISVAVTEGQALKPGDPLLAIDPVPYQIAVREAEAKLDSVRTDFANLKASFGSLDRQIALADETIKLRQADLDRKQQLAGNRVGTQADVDQARLAVTAARTQAELLRQQRVNVLNQIVGDPNLPIEKFPAYMQAQAELDKARRDLDNTTIRSPIAGTATQVASIQLGRYLTAGTAIFAIVGRDDTWVDANPKETDLTYVRPGQAATVTVDAYPDRVWHGTVEAIAPGTGAQFSILPAQNASGNWVKVVQRIPVRVAFSPGEDVGALRAGMSAYVSIDTGRQRSLQGVVGGLFDFGTAHAQDVAEAAPHR